MIENIIWLSVAFMCITGGILFLTFAAKMWDGSL